MTLETRSLERTFRYNSVDLTDPGAQYSAEEVRDLYTATYPELANAAIEGPEQKEGKLVYTFRRPVGTKGADSVQMFWRDIYDGKIPLPYKTALVADVYRCYMVWCQRNSITIPSRINRFVPTFAAMGDVHRGVIQTKRTTRRRVFLMGNEADVLEFSLEADRYCETTERK
jgi:PRTRC genetic system protein C